MVSQGPAVARNAQELLSEFVQTGRQEPFEEIVRRYAGMVFNVCLQILKDTHDAEDATQAVFLTLAVQAKTANGVKYIGPWLQRVAQRLSLDVKRSKTRRKAREERHSALTIARNGDNVPDHGRNLDMEELKGILRDELDRLPAKYRLPLILHYFGGLKPEEMARELGCKTSTLGVRLHRGRKMLADSLSERGMVVSGSILGVALAAMIHSTVTDHLVQSTSHAAVHFACGHTVAAGISPQVLTFNRIAASSLTLARLKAAITAGILIAGAVAGAAQIVTHTHIFDGHFGLGSELRSWLAPLFRAFSRPLIADAGAQAAPKVQPDLEFANSFMAMPDKLLLSEPWTSVTPVSVEPLPTHTIVSTNIPELRPSAPALAPSYAAPLTFSRPTPKSDTAAHLPAASTASPSAAPSAPVAVAPGAPVLSGPVSADVLTVGGRAGEYASMRFDRPITYQSRQLVVGDHGSASVAQTAGKVKVAEQLAIGKSSDGSGTYTISGQSELTAASIDVGQAGKGKVIQIAPAVATADTVTLGKDGGTGAYDLQGGSLYTTQLDVGVKGAGEFNQSGGSANSHGVHVAVDRGSTGSVNLDAGTFAAEDQVIGAVGDGRVIQKGGTNKTSNLKIGSADTGIGSYTLTGGKIEVQRAGTASAPQAQIIVGSNAQGTLQIGNSQKTGTIVESTNNAGAPGASLVVRAKPSARGTVRGWGDVRLSGTVEDNGKVIADGFGADRTLDLSQVGKVTNTIENPPDGSNGWFARSGGKLCLPALSVQAGTNSYTWGESSNDARPDLINSLRVTLHDVTQPGALDIELAATDRTDLPLPPVGYKLLSIWQSNLDQAGASAVDFVVRYDQTQLNEAAQIDAILGDSPSVQLLTYTDQWQTATPGQAWVEGDQHLLYATGISPAPIFAIAVPDSGSIGSPAPEPGGALVLTSLAGAILRRRRRR